MYMLAKTITVGVAIFLPYITIDNAACHTKRWLSYVMSFSYYRKVSNIRRTKSQNLNASRLILQLSLPNPLKPGVKLRMKM